MKKYLNALIILSFFVPTVAFSAPREITVDNLVKALEEIDIKAKHAGSIVLVKDALLSLIKENKQLKKRIEEYERSKNNGGNGSSVEGKSGEKTGSN